ncbi:arylamine N-acetyltransferase family protein [Ilumatobacter coccineus]|uniref:Putative acetyltransferase n=1 Tax=Ilumatobacter coccineus (strain NBRC 103263 / KCTC 29153 / YM16-304) TaxID=1313172 RepID=A0A6C7E6T4_ILUCY|nr:arylamine N-acetyltransferase [Ilumatobacter coccineus]BAN03414.1 putative acetyltransferase [Ilumatobacter coccineus YM16-304]
MAGGFDVDAYLERIGRERPAAADAATLGDLQYAHLVAVPFENLDIVFAGGVPHDRDEAVGKILRGRGGWCFELNGACSMLLDELGYDVKLIGAAVLLDGPSKVLDHLALEVTPRESDGDAEVGAPMLVDVGFGDTFVRPLELNRSGPQDGGTNDFEFIPSPQGTTLAEVVDGIPEARYRFKRVAHRFDDFAPAASSMQRDPAKHWRSKPFATRLLGNGTDRVTLTHDTLKFRRAGTQTEQPVARHEWDDALGEWFGVERPGPWPDAT